ncbi:MULTISPECIES: DUF4926 domain-containing protein [unclassified Sphingomonas]|uniref:DUF4926 domain-containing protein n=1 Tax=Sphingomonas TaxID=13687 RepID=UPI0009699C38|nr:MULTISPECIES: DUF4926 domain-containing protein [unclassified Sphingomonas]MBN8813624.1 DUF4926 domain-containing protein [Sphingomonas sp.]OJY52339.1 MAG: hypothetical protein BGP17_08055 [Sphingomonas sp. 67-41]
MQAKVNDTVRLTEMLPNDGLLQGAIGVVVAEFSEPNEAYEVEFSNDEGVTVAQVALLPDQFVVIK